MKIRKPHAPKAKAAPGPPPPPVPAEIPFEEQTWCGCTVTGILIGAHRKYERVTQFCGSVHSDPRMHTKLRIKHKRR